MKPDKLEAAERQFSLFWGGPFNRLFRLTGRADASAPNLATRIAGALLLAFLPLAVLSFIEGTAYGPARAVPFLGDVSALIRFLVCLPLLIGIEPLAERAVVNIVEYFRSSGLVRQADAGRYESLVARIDRLSDSLIPEILLIALTVLLTGMSGMLVPAGQSHWMLSPADGGYTAAGHWYRLVSLSLYRFLLLRWLWRYGLWVWFLWNLSRLRLDLSASHPDRAGGLRILALGQKGFVAFVLTLSIQLASQIAGAVMYAGVPLSAFYPAIAGYALIVMVLFLGPLAAFAPQMFACKRLGVLTYGILGEKYTSQFEERWIEGGKPPSEPLLGTADIQSLADLANSYAVVREMGMVPFDRGDALGFLAAALAPFLPLLLLIYPADELVRQILKLVF